MKSTINTILSFTSVASALLLVYCSMNYESKGYISIHNSTREAQMANKKNTDAIARKNAAKARMKNAQSNGSTMQSKTKKRGLRGSNYSEVSSQNPILPQINVIR